jgi:uncharacterized membrane protein
MISLIEIQSATARFPIPLMLMLSSAFFDAAGLVTRRPQFRETSFLIQLLGVVACIVTIVLELPGNPFAGSVGGMTARVVRHLSSGIINLGIFAGLAIWRVRQRNVFSDRSQLAFTLVSLAGVAAVSAVGYLGVHSDR